MDSRLRGSDGMRAGVTGWDAGRDELGCGGSYELGCEGDGMVTGAAVEVAYYLVGRDTIDMKVIR